MTSENSGGGTSGFMMRVHFRVLQCGMKANNIKSQDIVSFSGARGLRVIRSCLLACCSHSRLLSSSNSASQILSRLVTFASASYGFPPAMTKQRNFDDVPFSKPGRAARTWLSQKALKGMKVATPSFNWTNLSSTFGRGVSVLASDRLPYVGYARPLAIPPRWSSRGDDRPLLRGHDRHLQSS